MNSTATAARPGTSRRTTTVERMPIRTMLSEVRSRLERLSAGDAYRAVGDGATLIDVRTSDQIQADGHIPEALELRLNVLEWRLDPESDSRHPKAPDLGDQVVVICNEGYCSSLAASRLQALGFSRATDVVGGFKAWRAQDLPVVSGDTRTPDPRRTMET